ncbi:helix-turn-helix transcriptional regulator [Methylopila sp. M107]|uniref:helix-turn-helix transcriptional regulator n=1 Tax=Methylopila sp. M107 TaxID=1101190 RepID=UPI00058B33E9|nr:helix-turn-helix transcriptional regulator [Methylopila sp. M107]
MSGEARRLYEEAAELRPLWRLDAGRTLFVGPLDYNAPHEHGAPVFLSSLGAPFGLRLGGAGDWLTCHAAVVPAGKVHELQVGGEPIAVLYVEPTLANAHIFAPLMRDAEDIGGALVGRSNVTGFVRDLYEDGESLGWAGSALDDLLAFGASGARRAIDPRIVQVARALGEADETTPDLSRFASSTGLSASRLRRLFAQEIGTPFSRYRSWARMRRAIDAVVAGANFTTAAHDAGFSDQAHFAHDFRRTFGAPASRSLTGVRR